jgi:hypothetical protein
MFVGHYAPSFAIKSARPEIPLWLLFVAVQLLDFASSILIIVGIKNMPYTHSLVAAMLWALGAILLIGPLLGFGMVSAFWVGAAVFSHWVLDFLVHRPDLALYGDSMKVGLGLYSLPAIEFSLEAIFLYAGMALYLRATRPINFIGRFGLPVFGLVMLAFQALLFFGPLPRSPIQFSIELLLSFTLFTAVAAWLAHQREAA